MHIRHSKAVGVQTIMLNHPISPWVANCYSYKITFSSVLQDCLFVGCLTSQQHASVSQGRICSDSFTCCHTETEVADPTFHLTQSQYTDTGPTSPSADSITPGAWQGSHWSANVLSHWYDSTPEKSRRKLDSNPGPSALEADALPLGQRGGVLQEMKQSYTQWSG